MRHSQRGSSICASCFALPESSTAIRKCRLPLLAPWLRSTLRSGRCASSCCGACRQCPAERGGSQRHGHRRPPDTGPTSPSPSPNQTKTQKQISPSQTQALDAQPQPAPDTGAQPQLQPSWSRHRRRPPPRSLLVFRFRRPSRRPSESRLVAGSLLANEQGQRSKQGSPQPHLGYRRLAAKISLSNCLFRGHGGALESR